MNGATSHVRFGPYLSPVVVPGTVVQCEARGLVTVVGQSNAPISWPIGRKDERDELIVFKGLARAVRQETPAAVAAAWGVNQHVAEQWHAACRAPRTRKKQTRKSLPIPWKPADDAIICTTTLVDAARQTGRTITAIRKRRRSLGLPDGRLAASRASGTALQFQADLACDILRQRTVALASSLALLQGNMDEAKARVAFWRSLTVLRTMARGTA